MRLLDPLDMIVRSVAGVCLFAVFALVTAQVASRFLFNFSLAAASELSIYAMIWSVFLGAAVAFRRGEHIAMDIIRDRLPPMLSRLANLLIFVLLALFLVLVAVKGYDLSQRAMRQMSPAAKIPVGYVSMAMPVGSVLALVFLVENSLAALFRPVRKDKAAP